MRLRGAIFDLDGTLADTIPVCLEACRRAVKHYSGRHLTDEEIRSMFGPSEIGIIQRMVPDRWQECLETYLRMYEEEHERCRSAFPGVERALQMLRERGVALAVVSGKGERAAAISLRYIGLEAPFDFVETGSPEGDIKALNIRKVVAKWAVAPERVAYVGDAPSDIRAAKECGVLSVGAAWAPSTNFDRLNAQEPALIFRDVESFVRWIDVNVETNGRL